MGRICYFEKKKGEKFHEVIQKLQLVGGQNIYFDPATSSVMAFENMYRNFPRESENKFFTLFSVQKVLGVFNKIFK